MKAVVQRCRAARVEVEGNVVGAIESGLTVFVAAMEGDEHPQIAKLAQKVAALRIFDNAEGKFDLNVQQAGGEILVISNFTLAGEAKKGNRPNFSLAARPDTAQALVDAFATLLRAQGIRVATGRFGADMKVVVENDGPVTILLEATSTVEFDRTSDTV
jgi:D-tyrosyl-tRNA(Tyr) deacylase